MTSSNERAQWAVVAQNAGASLSPGQLAAVINLTCAAPATLPEAQTVLQTVWGPRPT